MIKSTYSNASAIIVGSRHTQTEVSRYRVPTFYIPENGIDPDDFKMQARPPLHDRKLRGIFVGRLVPYKGADVAIKGCANALREGHMELEIIGDGPEMSSLMSIVAALGLGEAVTFCGWLSHDEVASRLAASDLLVFPSIREFGGGVVLEAMACGVVPIVVDYGGPGELVADDTGFRIPLSKKEMIINSLSRAINQILDSRSTLGERAVASRERALNTYAWHEKAKQIAKVYEAINFG